MQATTLHERQWYKQLHERTKRQCGLPMMTIVFLEAIDSVRLEARTFGCGMA